MSDSRRAARLDAYLALATERPELFETPPGGVRILLDRAEIAAVEDEVGDEIGILVDDPWIFVLRDAVEFPDGARRAHTRTINRLGHGVAALPLLGGRIVLARHFRHAVRRWLLEIPRGAVEAGQTAEDTVRTELAEEIGGRVRSIQELGFAFGTTNQQANGARLFLAELEAIGAPQISEGIAAVETYSVAEFEDLLARGEILDAFTIAAYTHARLRGLI
jgi:ADP-ribose pyrophosphatase